MSGLSQKFQEIFKQLRSKGTLSEADVKTAMREVKLALLEADVSFKVVKDFVKSVEEKAVGVNLAERLNPGETVIKIVVEELTAILGQTPKEPELKPGVISVILLMGLQGAGKTTTAAKLAKKLLSSGKQPILVPLDVYRPAAKEQLKINAGKVGVTMFDTDSQNPVEIAKKAYEYAKENHYNVMILDTAGRLHVDEEKMEELQRIKESIPVTDSLFVIDAMSGQDALTTVTAFHEKISIDGIILTKTDGDTRGGAALSVTSVTGRPIYYIGVGEKPEDLESFYPDRMAKRILGMGDVMSLIEKAEALSKNDEAGEMAKRLEAGKFDYNDYKEQLSMMKKMGGIRSLLDALPGEGSRFQKALGQVDVGESEKKLKRTAVIIDSMTKEERSHPELLNLPRKARIAKGAGVDIQEVHKLVKQFETTRKMMKQMGGKGKGKGGKFKFPF